MSEAVVASKTPFGVEAEEGKTYFWCSGGRGGNQPFCDGSHKDTEFRPVPYKAEESGTVYFCGCKQTQNQPRCDGTHRNID